MVSSSILAAAAAASTAAVAAAVHASHARCCLLSVCSDMQIAPGWLA
jgi:hypothetical protein